MILDGLRWLLGCCAEERAATVAAVAERVARREPLPGYITITNPSYAEFLALQARRAQSTEKTMEKQNPALELLSTRVHELEKERAELFDKDALASGKRTSREERRGEIDDELHQLRRSMRLITGEIAHPSINQPPNARLQEGVFGGMVGGAADEKIASIRIKTDGIAQQQNHRTTMRPHDLAVRRLSEELHNIHPAQRETWLQVGYSLHKLASDGGWATAIPPVALGELGVKHRVHARATEILIAMRNDLSLTTGAQSNLTYSIDVLRDDALSTIRAELEEATPGSRRPLYGLGGGWYAQDAMADATGLASQQKAEQAPATEASLMAKLGGAFLRLDEEALAVERTWREAVASGIEIGDASLVGQHLAAVRGSIECVNGYMAAAVDALAQEVVGADEARD